MRDFSDDYTVTAAKNWLRLAPAFLNGHLLSSVRTVAADSGLRTRDALIAAGMRRVAVPQETSERIEFVTKWIQRNQRRVAAGLPISVLVLALTAAEAEAQDGLVNLAEQKGVAAVEVLANGDVQVTYTNGNVVVLAENSVVISATGEVLVTVAVAEGAALSAGVALAGGVVGGAAAIGLTGLLASLSGDGAGTGTTGGTTSGGKTGGGVTDTGVGGTVVDGYISGATVFRDLNANRILDAGEPNVVTDASGNFSGLTGTGGVLVSVGGTDISTGKPFTGIMTAPAGASYVTPLTSLVQAMVEANPALSVADANSAVLGAFDLASDLNLLTFDPFGGDDADIFAAGAKVAAIMMVAAAAAGDTPAEQANAVRAVALSLANQITENAELDDQPLQLLTPDTILDALKDALGADSTNGDDTTNLAKATALGAIFEAIDDNFTSDLELNFNEIIVAIEGIQTYLQGDFVDDIEDGILPETGNIGQEISLFTSLRPIVEERFKILTLSEPFLDGFEGRGLTINGSGRTGSTVVVKIGGFTSQGVVVDQEGGWSFTLVADNLETIGETTGLQNVEMTATAFEITNGVTVTSPVVSIGLFRVDLTPPASPVFTATVAGDNVINAIEASAGVRFTGTFDADTNRVFYSTDDRNFMSAERGVDSSGGTFEFTLRNTSDRIGGPQLPTSDGQFTVYMYAEDSARNRSETVTKILTVDRIAPTAADITNVTVDANDILTISGTASREADQTLTLVIQPPAPLQSISVTAMISDGGFTYVHPTALPNGSYTVTPRLVDQAGNVTLGDGYEITIGAPPTPQALFAAAETVAEMTAAITALAEQEDLEIDSDLLPELAADLFLQRGGVYRFEFTSEKVPEFSVGTPGVTVTDNLSGTDVSGTFFVPFGMIDILDDKLSAARDPVGVFELTLALPDNNQNIVTGAGGLGLRLDETVLRMETVLTARSELPPNDLLRVMLGETAANKIIDAFAAANGGSIAFTALTISASGTTSAENATNSVTGETTDLTGYDLSLTFLQVGIVGIDAFLTNPAESLSFVNAIQFAPSTNEGATESIEVASEFLATTYLDVAYLPAPAPTAEDLSEMVNAAVDLRLAVDAVISAQNAGELTVALLQEMVDTAGETHDEAMVALRQLSGEQLSAADVNRLLAFLVQPVADQFAGLSTANNAFAPDVTSLTDLLDNSDLVPSAILNETQVFFHVSNPDILVINGVEVNIDAAVRSLVTLPTNANVELFALDKSNPDLTWQVTPQGNVVVAAYLGEQQTVLQDVLLVFRPTGSLLSHVKNVGQLADANNSFYINPTVADAGGIVFSMNSTSTELSTGERAFTTYHVPLALFDVISGPYTVADIVVDNSTRTLLNFTIPAGSAGLDFSATSVIALKAAGLSNGPPQIDQMLIQVADRLVDDQYSLHVKYIQNFPWEGPTPTFKALPGYVNDYNVVLQGAAPVGILLEAKATADINGDMDGGSQTQDSVYYFDLASKDITSVQTTGKNAAVDVLFGQGTNDIIIPLGAQGTAEEKIYLPFEGSGNPPGVETILVDLSDVFAGNRIAIYGFDLAEDKIAFFGSDLLDNANFSVTSVVVTDIENFNTQDILNALELDGLPSDLSFFAVNDANSTILFVAADSGSGQVAWLDNVDWQDAAATTDGLQLSAFPLEDLLVPLPT